MVFTKEKVIRSEFERWLRGYVDADCLERRIIRAIEQKDFETVELFLFQAYKAGFENGENS